MSLSDMPPPEQPKSGDWLTRRMSMWIAAGAVGLIALMVAVGSMIDDPAMDESASSDAAPSELASEPSPEPEPEPEPDETQDEAPPQSNEVRAADAPAKAACLHFRNVIQDAADGLLTNEEVREKLIEVRDSASGSETAGVGDSATELVRSITANDSAGFIDAVTAMDEACERGGV